MPVIRVSVSFGYKATNIQCEWPLTCAGCGTEEELPETY